jgi:Domain of unknown function (DUF4404)
MDPEYLSDHLAKLHEELRNVRNVDPRSNQLLSEVLKDIQRLLETSASSPAAGSPAAEAPGAGTPAAGTPAAATLAGRLESVAVQFEADHPTLAASSRRLIDLLGNAGL